MVRSRGIQVAVAIAAAAILAVLIYVWGVPRHAVEPTTPAPVASAPAAPPSATAPAPAAQAPSAGQVAATSPAGTGVTQQVGAPPASSGQAATSAQPSATVPLSFDVVRVEPDGSSVVAGRAPPGSKVELLRNGQPISNAIADATGAFAMVPPALEPGTHELSLRCMVDGKELQSGDTVSVVVANDRKTAPMVALLSPNKPAQILSRPGEQSVQVATSAPPQAGGAPVPPAPGQSASAPEQAAGAPAVPAAAGSRSAVVVDAVEAEEGRMFVSGRAAPAATVRLYLNDSYVASAVTGPDGKLSFTIERGLAPGGYRVRLDDVEASNGAVKSRAEVAFTMPAPAVVGAVPTPAGQGASHPPAGGAPVGTAASNAPAGSASSSAVIIPEVNTTTVVRGDNLWRISRRVYGRGARYTVIYDANQNQIRNHDLIYPGQVFVLPRG